MILLSATAICHRCKRRVPASVEVYEEWTWEPYAAATRTRLGPIRLPAGWQTTAEGEWCGCAVSSKGRT